MSGRKILLLLTLLSLGLYAFYPAASARPDANAKTVIQYLTKINTDGSAEFYFIFKINKARIQEYRASGFSISALCQTNNGDYTYSQEQHGEDIWCTFTSHFENLKELENQLQLDFSENQMTPSSTSRLTINRLEINDGAFYLDLSWSNFPCRLVDGSLEGCEWSVQMPGKVGNNNASRIEGTTLTWDMSTAAAPHTFMAQSGVGNSFLGMDSNLAVIGGIVLLGCCCVLLPITAGVGFFLIRRKSVSGKAEVVADAGIPNS